MVSAHPPPACFEIAPFLIIVRVWSCKFPLAAQLPLHSSRYIRNYVFVSMEINWYLGEFVQKNRLKDPDPLRAVRTFIILRRLKAVPRNLKLKVFSLNTLFMKNWWRSSHSNILVVALSQLVCAWILFWIRHKTNSHSRRNSPDWSPTKLQSVAKWIMLKKVHGTILLPSQIRNCVLNCLEENTNQFYPFHIPK